MLAVLRLVWARQQGKTLAKLYNKMSEITDALGDATTLFGVAVTLCVLVTGFFVGRRWLSKSDGVSDNEDWSDPEVDQWWEQRKEEQRNGE